MNEGMQVALANAIKEMLTVATDTVLDKHENPNRMVKTYEKCIRSINHTNFEQHKDLIKTDRIDDIQDVQLSGFAAIMAFRNFVDLMEDFNRHDHAVS